MDLLLGAKEHVQSHLILTKIQDTGSHPHFSSEGIEAQGMVFTCPQSHSMEVSEPKSEPKSVLLWSHNT